MSEKQPRENDRDSVFERVVEFLNKKLPEALFAAYSEVMIDGHAEAEREVHHFKLPAELLEAIEEASASGTRKAIDAYFRERRKEARDWREKNTRLLLRNYRRLTDYLDNAVFDSEQAAETDADFVRLMRNLNYPVEDELFADSIRKEHAKTAVIMSHVNRMLTLYRQQCEYSGREEDLRKWRALEGLYLSDDPSDADEIAHSEFVDRRTVYRDRDAAVKDMTFYLFGVGALEA